jgi:hypothetical protein
MANTDVHRLSRNEIAVLDYMSKEVYVVELSIDVADIDDLYEYCDALGLPTRDVAIMTYVDQYTDL